MMKKQKQDLAAAAYKELLEIIQTGTVDDRCRAISLLFDHLRDK